MLVQEKFKDDNIFSLINDIEILPFTGLTGLNTYMLLKYGERNILPMVENLDNAIIATMLHDMYYEKWSKLYTLFNENVLAEGNKSEIITKVTADTGENNTTVTGENLHKVSAFDSDGLSDENSDNETRTTKDTTKNDTTETTTTEGKSGNYTNDFITYNKYLKNNSFYDIICVDVIKNITSAVLTLNI